LGLPFKRIAVTRPPAAWFHGITRTLFELYRQTLVELGLSLFEVPVEFFHVPDVSRISALLAGLRAFEPEAVFGLSHGLHAILCRMPADRDGWRPNLFTEVLDIPTICCWDHAPLDVAEQVLHPPPKSAAESSAGALQALRRALTHPRLIHWSRDTGQSAIMRELGLLRADRVIYEASPTLPGFSPGAPPTVPGAAFIGHFYHADDPEPEYADLTRDTIDAWLGSGGRPVWDVLVERIDGMEEERRQRLALDLDQTMFWRYAHGLIVHRAQSALRTKVLGAAGVPVACHGNLPLGAPDNLRAMPGDIPFGPALAAVLSRYEVTIDVMNPAFVHGYSHKPLLAFASGGFVLVDRKQDFLDHFGDAGKAVSYDGAEDLAAKVELFLGNPRYRHETADAIRHEIESRFQLKDVLSRVLEAAAERSEAGGRRFAEDRPSKRVRDLLPGIRHSADWEGSRLEIPEREALLSASNPWVYMASIGLPAEVNRLREPHLRMSILVEEGRIGIAPIRDGSWELFGEQLVSRSAAPVTVTVELPREGVSNVILRNTEEPASRAWVLGASLCDRT
jgi:hypothetical protein